MLADMRTSLIHRVLVVDDYEPWRRYIESALRASPRWQVVGEAADGVDAVHKAQVLRPDLILLDIGLPVLSGIEAARQILAFDANRRILFLSENRSWAVVEAALGTGGPGYVLKSDAGRDLLCAMEAVVEGQRFISRSLRGYCADGSIRLFARRAKESSQSRAPEGTRMATPSWQLRGQYYETCSCDFVCPCILGQMAVLPSKGTCTFAMGFQIERGSYGSVSLDGLGFIVLGLTPEAMGKGNWSVGLIIDEKANVQQREAITAIARGEAGGPMAALSGLIGKFLGAESAPIRFERHGVKWSVTAAALVDMTAEGAMGINSNATEPLSLDNTGHPASDRLAVAHALKSRVRALWRTWDDASGKNNGHFAPFAWRSA
jgi:DNA-binding NarL/FixJ family response regulator